MTIKESLIWAFHDVELPFSEALLLLAHATGTTKEYILGHDATFVEHKNLEIFKILVKKRKKGFPIAYLRNKKEFFGLSFYVDERVLIPRPETELIIETLLTEFNTSAKEYNSPLFPLTIADIGTGSGALAVSLAHNIPHAHIHATDISDDALAVAKKNAEYHKVKNKITFHNGDLLEPFIKNNIILDSIVTNLPYIAHNDKKVHPEVHNYEPHVALYTGKKGVDHYRRFFDQLLLLPKIPSLLLGEFGFDQANLMQEIIDIFFLKIQKIRYKGTATFHRDLAGIPRVFLISSRSI